jgi:hypothetical protein
LIEKWIQRESNKPGIVERYGSAERYGEILSNFSEKLALHLYQNRDKNQGYGIKYDVKIEDIVELQLSDIELEYSELGREIKSKSLLNRNGEGFYKFAHKSILELFLARVLIHKKDILEIFDFRGMEMVSLFHHEMMVKHIRTLEGSFSTYIHRNKYITNSNVRESSIFSKGFRKYIFHVASFIYKFYFFERLARLFRPKRKLTFLSNSSKLIISKSETLEYFRANSEFSLVISNCDKINPITLINFKKAKSIILVDLINYSLLYELYDILVLLSLNLNSKNPNSKALKHRDKIINWLSEKFIQYECVELNNYLKFRIDDDYFSLDFIFSQIERYDTEAMFKKKIPYYSTILFNSENKEKLLVDYFPYYSFLKKISTESFLTDNFTLTLLKYRIKIPQENEDLSFAKIDSLELSSFTDIYQMKDKFFSVKIINKLQVINEFIKNAQKLQEKLPDCNVEF